MKLDRIKFASLMGFISCRYALTITQDDMREIDTIIDIEVPEQVAQQVYPKNENVEALMKHMAEGTKKIEAIKEYRAITGTGLKESKDAVERYWPDSAKKYSAANLRSKLNTKVWDVTSYAAIDKFITELGD